MISEDLIKKIAANVTHNISGNFRTGNSADTGATDIESVSRQLREIQSAVRQLEQKLRSLTAHHPVHSLPVINQSGTLHPSQELFDIPEEVAEFVDYLETKQCVLEPGKPCCGRGECRSRGF
ncbi:MAG TPA: hypothetical protein VFC63_04860 [Blastocatellia bacterium]|nr:hypothetical protein [Blastocatellia bacterium]